MGNFRGLHVWQLAKELAVSIYKMSEHYPKLNKDYRFKSQICAAAVSVPSNIAEGDESGTNKQSVRYFYIAKASCAEVITQLIILEEIDYIPKEISEKYISRCEHISRILNKLIAARTSTSEDL